MKDFLSLLASTLFSNGTGFVVPFIRFVAVFRETIFASLQETKTKVLNHLSIHTQNPFCLYCVFKTEK